MEATRSTVTVQPGTPSHMRRLNRSLVLGLLRQREPLSRSAIARAIGLSSTATTNVVGDMVQEGLLLEETGRVRGRKGRPYAALGINSRYGLAAGAELTDTNVTTVVIDWDAKVVATGKREFPPDPSPELIMSELVAALQDSIVSAQQVMDAPLRGIGIALQGFVDVEQGVSISISGLPSSWSLIPVKELVEKAFGVDVVVDWRVYAAALAEMWVGAARGADEFLYVSVGYGTAMVSVIDRVIVRRRNSLGGQAGQLGHIMVAQNGKRCYSCGNLGCLDNESSIPAIVQKVRAALDSGVESVLQEQARQDGRPVSFQDVVTAANLGDKLALTVREEAGEYLGIALAYLLHLLNPSLVIVGGEIVALGEPFLDEVRRAVRHHCLARSFRDADIVFSDLKPDAATLGAATLILS